MIAAKISQYGKISVRLLNIGKIHRKVENERDAENFRSTEPS